MNQFVWYGEPEDGYDYNDVIVMSPAGDALLVGGQEVELQNLVRELEVQTGQSIPVRTAGEINAKLFKQMGEGYVELPMSWSQDTVNRLRMHNSKKVGLHG